MVSVSGMTFAFASAVWGKGDRIARQQRVER